VSHRRVQRLHYTLVDDSAYKGCPLIEGKADGFRYHLASGHLTVEPEEHYSTVGSARDAVGPFLRAWELDVVLRDGRGLLTFKYDSADVVDLGPPALGPPGSGETVTRVVQNEVGCGLDAILAHVQRSEYPRPPSCFGVTPDVETLWQRLEMSHQGREPRASMAYFCLTVVERLGLGRSGGSKKGRPAAAKKFGISLNLLDAMGSLSAPHRKHLPERQLSGHEEDWLYGAVRLLIRRVAEVAQDPSAADRKITLADHPLPRK
jgi:hypothetical protein